MKTRHYLHFVEHMLQHRDRVGNGEDTRETNPGVASRASALCKLFLSLVNYLNYNNLAISYDDETVHFSSHYSLSILIENQMCSAKAVLCLLCR